MCYTTSMKWLASPPIRNATSALGILNDENQDYTSVYSPQLWTGAAWSWFRPTKIQKSKKKKKKVKVPLIPYQRLGALKHGV